MKQFRKLLFWMHLVTAVAAAALVLVMSVTGVLLTYQRQITAWADIRGLDAGPPSPDARRLGAEALIASVRRTRSGTPTTLKWHADPAAPAEVAFGREKTVFVDAYTGRVLGEGSAAARGFFRKVVAWHRWLGAEGEGRDRGKALTGAANLGFLFLVMSGFYLWWPRNLTWRAVRGVIVFRRGLAPKARDFNWHNVIGFWSCVPLFVIVLSGVVISYPWASNLVYRAVGEEPPPARAPGGGPGAGAQASAGGRPAGAERRSERGEGRGPAERGGRGGEDREPIDLSGIDPLQARAERQVPGWRSITLQLPESAGDPVSFNIDRGSGGQPQKRATLALVRGTGEVAKWEPFSGVTPGRRVRSILRFAHTGEVLGLPGQTLAGILSAGATVLVWTGLALTLRRFRAWRGRRGARAPEAAAMPEPRREPVGV